VTVAERRGILGLGTDASTNIRFAFAVLAVLVALLAGSALVLLPWFVLVVVLDVVVTVLQRLPIARRGVLDSLSLGLLAVAGGAAALGFAEAGASGLVLVLVPGYHAGTRFGRLGALLVAVVGTVTVLVVLGVTDVGQLGLGVLAWVSASLLIGTIGAWNKRLLHEQGVRDEDPSAREAVELINRLQELADHMSTGLDAPASASLTLDLLAAEVPSARSAILVSGDDQHLVPVALRGSTRAPWDVSDQVIELLQRRRSRWEPAQVDLLAGEGRWRRALVVPFTLASGPTTVLVAERADSEEFTPEEEQRAAELVHRLAPALQAGLLFDTLKETASLEERNRIARDIHDGIAQELAALGYQVDALRMAAGPVGTPLRSGLEDVRSGLSAAMADLRSHIVDLRTAERPGTGLGAVVASSVQSFGSIAGMRTTVTISGGNRRLDARVEYLVHRLVMDVLGDAQTCGAHTVTVTLTLSHAGAAVVEITHDGDPRRSRQSFDDTTLAELGATVQVTTAGRATTVNLTVQEPEAGLTPVLGH